ncbi:MAG TPA: hypothetical protein VHH88_12455, partial [Verrucomicrobiae bacterium]|nr:hypothetical protein [Verrucomicrobiae bacterium]
MTANHDRREEVYSVVNNTASEAARQKWLPLIACAAGFVIIAIGCLILACWILRVAPLMAAFPQFGAMNPVTAGLVIIAGIALHRFGTRKQQGRFDKIGILLASILVLASAARLVGFIAGPKSILAFEAPGLSYPVSREIAPNTAICLLLCGVGLLLADRRGRSFLRASQVMVILSGVIALLAVVGYSYQVLFLSRFKGFMPMALETAVALIVFCAGFLAARPKRGVMALITSPSSGGAVARRLLPVAILIPWLLGGV